MIEREEAGRDAAATEVNVTNPPQRVFRSRLELFVADGENGALPGEKMTDSTYQEVGEPLPAPTLDMHRAITALTAALTMLDHNNQRYEACTDPELRLVLAHQRDAGRKQVAMLLEWMRRRDTALGKEMKEALFKAGPIVAPFHYDE
jgi:hypothetical protein